MDDIFEDFKDNVLTWFVNYLCIRIDRLDKGTFPNCMWQVVVHKVQLCNKYHNSDERSILFDVPNDIAHMLETTQQDRYENRKLQGSIYNASAQKLWQIKLCAGNVQSRLPWNNDFKKRLSSQEIKLRKRDLFVNLSILSPMNSHEHLKKKENHPCQIGIVLTLFWYIKKIIYFFISWEVR